MTAAAPAAAPALLRDALLAIGMLLSTASQLRPDNLPVGPGEVCLAIWLFMALAREARRLGPPLTPALARLLAFWTAFALAQSVGSVVGLATEDIRDDDAAIHDVIAYLLMAGVSCLVVVEPNAARRLRRICWLLAALGVPFYALQLATAWGGLDLPKISPWYWDRLRGWSENPNQLALACTATGLLALHLAETAAAGAERLAALGCCAFTLSVGTLTHSDAFKLVLLTAVPIFLAFTFRRWIIEAGARLTPRSALVWFLLLALPLSLAATIPFSPWISADLERLAVDISKDKGKGTEAEAVLRFQLWSEAVKRSIDSSMLGLGPGAHLVSTIYKRDPPPNFEAHNTALDLMTQGGILAVLGLVWLVATALRSVCRARLAALATLLCGIGIFSMFHLIVRHPIFWFAVALSLAAAERRPSEAVAPLRLATGRV